MPQRCPLGIWSSGERPGQVIQVEVVTEPSQIKWLTQESV